MNADYVWKLSKFGRLTSTRLRFDDDFADRLNYQFTGLMLFVFVGIIGIRQYVGKPIQCWTPQEFTRSWEEYAENYCWVASTYFLNFGTMPASMLLSMHAESPSGGTYLIPNSRRLVVRPALQIDTSQSHAGERLPAGRYISYYQWAPILLAIQSFLFYVPCLIWRLFASQSGFHLRRIMQLASEAALAAPTESDAGSPSAADVPKSNTKRLSLQNNFNQSGHPSAEPSSFAPTKSVRTLARYLDMCLMRQRELRLANFFSTVLTETTINDSSRAPNLQKRTAQEEKLKLDHTQLPMQWDKCAPHENTKFANLRQNNCRNNLDTHCPMCPSISKILCFYQSESNMKYPDIGINHIHMARQSHLSNCTRHSHTRTCDSDNEESFKHRSEVHIRRYCCRCYSMNRRNGSLSGCCSKYQGNFLVRLHLLVKFLYLVNAIAQIFLLEHYTGVQYNFYGIRVLYDLMRGRQWEESGHFPRVTFCDFEARKLAQSHYYTLQCVLPINMFLEKIYIFLWLWFFLVGVITLICIIIWILRIGSQNCRAAWIRHHLITIRQFNRNFRSCMHFVENHLGPDGVFVLRLIAQNYGDLVAGDIIGELWSAYWQRQQPVSEKKLSQFEGTCEYRKPEDILKHAIHGKRHQRQGVPPGEYGRTTNKDTMSHRPRSPRKQEKIPDRISGYSATIMATEMIHPSDRFAVPLLAPTRKPPSINSRDSSRYSQDSRGRDRSDSPPPIPQRASDVTDQSMSDHRSMNGEGLSCKSYSSAPDGLTTVNKFEETTGYHLDAEREDINVDRFNHEDEHLTQEFQVDGSGMNEYDGEYADEAQNDDHIV